MKAKYVFKQKAVVEKWIQTNNMFAKSLCPNIEAIKQFNNLTSVQRIEIKKRFDQCDEVRRKKIPTEESTEWIIGIMVDAHIIACKYDIDPLTAILCVNPICRPIERIIVR